MAPQGTAVKVYVNPDPGYTLAETNGLIYKNEIAGGIDIAIYKNGTNYQFSLGSYNVTVTATFVENNNPAQKTISINKSVSHGVAYTDPLIAAPGMPVKIYLVPNSGYGLADGSLEVKDKDGNSTGVTVTPTLPYTFTMPSQDVVVDVRFEEKNFAGLLANARDYLNAGQYDVAATLYEEAYKKRSGGSSADVAEVIFYSTLAQLGSILIEPDVRVLLGSGSLYMNVVPSTLEDWICDPATWTGDENQRWYQTWPGVQYDTAAEGKGPPLYVHTQFETKSATLPKLYGRINGSPVNFPTPFGDYAIAQGSNPDTRQKFNNLMFWILLSNNQNGFNGFVERVNLQVFGTKFEDAASRAATFPADTRIPLYPGLKTRFGLEKYYGSGDTNVGKAELDYIFGVLRTIKAAFEYLRAYNLTINLSPWMTSEILPEDGLDQIIDKIFALAETNQTHEGFWADVGNVASILPLKNNFLDMRDSSYLTRAKDDLSRALSMLNNSMSYWQGASSNFSATAKLNYKWAKDGLDAAKQALDGEGNGNFYFPKTLPESGPNAVWPIPARSDYAVNFAQFFTPGVFSLRNFITTENGDRAPSLFKIKWYEDRNDNFAPVITNDGVLVTAPITDNGAQNNVQGSSGAPYGIYSFEINTGNLRKIFPRGFEQQKYDLKKVDKAYFHQVFPTIPLWPTRPTYFIGDYRSAKNLYKYYH
jgi:hypothetical protein